MTLPVRRRLFLSVYILTISLLYYGVYLTVTKAICCALDVWRMGR